MSRSFSTWMHLCIQMNRSRYGKEEQNEFRKHTWRHLNKKNYVYPQNTIPRLYRRIYLGTFLYNKSLLSNNFFSGIINQIGEGRKKRGKYNEPNEYIFSLSDKVNCYNIYNYIRNIFLISF